MTFNPDQIAAMLAGTSFAAGLNVYATLATLGLLSRGGVIALPAGLDALRSWWIIAVCLALFVLEFFADKIPAFDLIWNALHTFVRIPIAAVLAWVATAHLSPGMQLGSAALAALIAFAAHGGKTALRAAVTPSPEPFSNMALSFGEDAGAIALTWIAVQHPYAAAVVVLILLIAVLLVMRWVLRALRGLFARARMALAG
ncbi:MAG TPA: DUF4126 domain-containing protein [Candidatus Binatia bacterium]|nr:DUF4126 domain-containing protein [Candidatus Binatia bacterium]